MVSTNSIYTSLPGSAAKVKLLGKLLNNVVEQHLGVIMENWKVIKGYPDYAISDTGCVKSLRYDRILKASYNDGRYQHVNLLNNKKRKTWAVHRLVIEHFGPAYPDTYSIVDHIDGNKANNHISNLEWVSIRENTLRGYGNQDKKVKVKELRKQGMTIKQIAEAVGMSAGFVQDTIHAV